MEADPLDEDEEYCLVDCETYAADDKDGENLMTSLEARPTFEYMGDTQKIIHDRRDRERDTARDQKIDAELDGQNVEENPVNQCRRTANDKITDDSHRKRLYLTMQYSARTPSFQPIF